MEFVLTCCSSAPNTPWRKLGRFAWYPVLLRLEQEGAIASHWGASENNRRARYYRLTRDGHRQLQAELQEWHQTTEIIARFLLAKAKDVL